MRIPQFVFRFIPALMLGADALTLAAPAPVLRLTGGGSAVTSTIQIHNPLNETLFPPEMPPPLFRWTDPQAGVTSWLVRVEGAGLARKLNFRVSLPQWQPEPETWSDIKRQTLDHPALVTVLGYDGDTAAVAKSTGAVRISTSRDRVDASLFYREVNLPFSEAVKDPSKIRWRFGSIASSEPPPIVLDHLPVCGNCHSFSSDGQVMGMDVDYANSKGSYVIAKTRPKMTLSVDDIMTWDDYRREDGELTFGLLSQVSPDGQCVISTVKDKSVFVPRPDLAFSQLFFPIKGILVVYDRMRRTFAPLPGADDPAYVQSNPIWSPDGQNVVFARAKAFDLKTTVGQGKVLLTPEECREFTQEGRPFKYDLYRVPYRQGRGGTPERLLGASQNDHSNYFPRYSPDGRWIVFCQAANYMLLQADSQLFIIPSGGGTARRLRANTPCMNSWHSWSPNSRWLVFSSKANSPYTQLFLTHIDAQGESTPAVLLANLTSPDRAANIPEFVNLPPTGIDRIDEHFLNDYSFERAANEFYRSGEPDRAIEQYQAALGLNPNNANAHQRLGFLLYNLRHQFRDGLVHTTEALRLDPKNNFAHSDLGMALLNQKQPERALLHFQAALQGMPFTTEPQYQPQSIRLALAQGCLQLRRNAEAADHLTEVLRLVPDDADAHYLLGLALILEGDIESSQRHYRQAVALKPEIDTSVRFHDILAANLAQVGRWEEAIQSAERALTLARASGKDDQARKLSDRVLQYQEEKLARRRSPD